MTKIDRFISFVFPIFASVLMLFFVPTWSGLDVGKTYFFVLITIILALVFFGGAVYNRKLILPHKSILISLGGLLLVTVVSAAFAQLPWFAFFGRVLELSTVGFMATSFLFVILAVYFFSIMKNTERYVKLSIGMFSAVLLFQIGLLFFGKNIGLNTFSLKTHSLVGSWHDLGMLSVIFLFVSLSLMFSKRMTPVRTTIFSIISTVSVFFIFLNNLRYLYAAGAVLAGYVLFLSIQAHKKQVMKYLPALLATLFLLVGFFLQPKIGPVLLKQGVTYSEVKPAIGATLTVLKKSMLHDPLLGAGPNHFSIAWSHYKPAVVNNSALWSTQFNVGYSSFFTLAVNYGILAFLGILALCVLYVVFCVKALMKLAQKEKKASLVQYLPYTRMFFMVSLFLWYLFFTQNLGVFAWVMFVLSMSITLGHLHFYEVLKFQSFEYKQTFSKKNKAIVIALALVAAVSMGYLGVKTTLKAYAYGIAERAENLLEAGQNDPALIMFSRAYGIDRNDIYARVVSSIYFQKANTIDAESITDENRETLQSYFKNTFTQAVQSGQVAFNRQPLDIENLFNLISVYRSVIPAVKDAYPQTLELINQGLVISPNNPTLYLLRARIELDNDNVAEAEKFAQTAVAAKNNYSEAYVFLSRLASLNNDADKTKQYLELAILSDDQNLTALSDYAGITLDARDYELAVNVFNRMLVINPNLHQARFYLALTLLELDRRDEALTQLEVLRAQFPNDTNLLNKIDEVKKGPAPVAQTQTETE